MMKFYIFEIKYWLRQPMMYIFFFINALMIFGATYSDSITVGGSFGNIHKNAPFVIQTYYSIMSLITLLMTTAFVLASTIRDFSYNTYQIIFTTPVNRLQYLIGKFLGAITVSVIPLLGISAGVIIGCMMPDMEPEKVGPFILNAHLASIWQLAIPNTFFSGAVVFMIAALTRNTIAAFVGSLILLLATGIAGEFAEDLDKEWLAIMMDPYGNSTFSILTKYWTVNQKNSEILPLTGLFLYNRFIFLALSIVLIAITANKFSFTEKSKAAKKAETSPNEIAASHYQPLPKVNPSYNRSASWEMYRTRLKYELFGIIKSPAFIVLMLAGLMNFVPNLVSNSGPFGLTAYPVTYYMIDNVQGAFYVFLIAIIIIYSGQLVWKERESKIEEIFDATPHPTWISYLSKFTSLAILIFIVQVVCIITCIIVQYAKGFTDIRLDVYIKSLLLIDYTGLMMLVIMAMFIHSLINNKYLAFFVFVIFLILNNFLWVMLEVETNMVQYSGRPSYVYSDMNSFGPYVSGLVWFRGYWMVFASMIAILSVFIWVRGKETSFKNKISLLQTGLKSNSGRVVVVLLLLWMVTGGFVYYNTEILNNHETSKQLEKLQADYEKNFKKYQGINQPRATDFIYFIDLYPEERKLNIKGSFWAKNKGSKPIDSVHFSLPRYFITTIKIANSKNILSNEELNYRIYSLNEPLQPGDSMKIEFTADYHAKGFENEVSFNSVVDNGSFFNNLDFVPAIGYQPNYELQEKDERKDHGLPEIARMPKLRRNCTDYCRNNYLSNNADWVNVESWFSTSGDQLAIAPGSLIKEWKEGGRNHYHYKLDHYSVNFYSFISAKYEVARTKHNGIDVEVYYDKRHEYNVENMERSMKKSLDYYITNFGPYYHKQVRIIEFPRYASFAQAFPGTMPYSEGIGFIAKIEDAEDIDMVFYVVAHEMAHQYWAHQEISAEMQGATMLTETFSQYSALMVMEKEYGRDAMKKFLKYEMDDYLRDRGTERLKELPLMEVENQGYIHYNKGSLVMYYLREMIGEEKLNTALRQFLNDFRYQQPPYPTSHHAVDIFKQHTPDSLQYLITDLFETITLFNNRTLEASAEQLNDGTYQLQLSIETLKFRADSLGRETKIPIKDWIEIGVFGEPEEGKETGEVIYRQRHLFSKNNSQITLILNKKPWKAGIDPMNILVDLVGDDNVKMVEMGEKNVLN